MESVRRYDHDALKSSAGEDLASGSLIVHNINARRRYVVLRLSPRTTLVYVH